MLRFSADHRTHLYFCVFLTICLPERGENSLEWHIVIRWQELSDLWKRWRYNFLSRLLHIFFYRLVMISKFLGVSRQLFIMDSIPWHSNFRCRQRFNHGPYNMDYDSGPKVIFFPICGWRLNMCMQNVTQWKRLLCAVYCISDISDINLWYVNLLRQMAWSPCFEWKSREKKRNYSFLLFFSFDLS